MHLASVRRLRRKFAHLANDPHGGRAGTELCDKQQNHDGSLEIMSCPVKDVNTHDRRVLFRKVFGVVHLLEQRVPQISFLPNPFASFVQ